MHFAIHLKMHQFSSFDERAKEEIETRDHHYCPLLRPNLPSLAERVTHMYAHTYARTHARLAKKYANYSLSRTYVANCYAASP